MHNTLKRALAALIAITFTLVPIAALASNAIPSSPLASPITSPIVTPTPTPIPGDLSANTPSAKQDASGAYIQLNIANPKAFADAKAAVQWRNKQGQWQDVVGWHSNTIAKPIKWWVSAKEFGAGQFRWVLLRNNKVVAQSEPFSLPKKAREMLTIKIK